MINILVGGHRSSNSFKDPLRQVRLSSDGVEKMVRSLPKIKRAAYSLKESSGRKRTTLTPVQTPDSRAKSIKVGKLHIIHKTFYKPIFNIAYYYFFYTQIFGIWNIGSQLSIENIYINTTILQNTLSKA